jgi:hypothetical protein
MKNEKDEKKMLAKQNSMPSMGVIPYEYSGALSIEGMEGCEEYSSTFPHTITWIEEGQYCKGEYVGIRENIGKNKSKVYVILCDGEEINIWGTKILDQLFDKSVPRVGDTICIIYDGECPSTRGLNPTKLFTLLVKRNTGE